MQGLRPGSYTVRFTFLGFAPKTQEIAITPAAPVVDVGTVQLTRVAVALGEVRLSPELVDYRLFAPEAVKCWPAGTGYALADWLRSRGHEPQFMDLPGRG